MQILKHIHSVIDYALALLKLVQNREVDGGRLTERLANISASRSLY